MYTSKIEKHYCVSGHHPFVIFALLAQKGVHFGTSFFALSVPWAPLGGPVSHKMGFGGGPKTGPKTGPKKDVNVEQFPDPFWDIFRELFANLPFLLETHGAYTRALILRAGALKIHHFGIPFSAPFLVPFWIPKIRPKWVPKWDPEKQENRI